jgi:hypothetical protein
MEDKEGVINQSKVWCKYVQLKVEWEGGGCD